jgi:hypothetical protein
MKEFAATMRQFKEEQIKASILSRQVAIDEFDRNKKAIDESEKLLDAKNELSKAEARLAMLSGQTYKNATNELEINKQLLMVDIARAKAKLALLEAEKGSGKPLKEALMRGQQKIEEAKAKQAADEETHRLALEAAKANNPVSSSYGQPPSPEAEAKRRVAIAQALHAAGISASENEYAVNKAQKDQNELLNSAENQTDIAITKARAELTKLQADLTGALPSLPSSHSSTQDKLSAPDVTDRQRMNLMAVGNSPLLDVSRQQLTELRLIRNQMKAGGIDNAFGSSPN